MMTKAKCDPTFFFKRRKNQSEKRPVPFAVTTETERNENVEKCKSQQLQNL